MFDLITGSAVRPLREGAPGSRTVSLVVHAAVIALIVGIPLLQVTAELPEVPTIMAFVVATPAPPPPPPPPLATARPATHAAPKPAGAFVAPVEVPSDVTPEATTGNTGALAAVDSGVEGGVEGGVPGGALGGVVGGLVPPAPPPPPPPPAAPPAPVRIGGLLTAPALLHRVEPIYPDLAIAAQVTGMVILEAVVDTHGCVDSVTVLRSPNRILERPAVDAAKQWRYTPLVLNGIPTPFELTI